MTNKENLRGPVATLDGVAGPIPARWPAHEMVGMS